jgi:hypothetical protein
MTDLETLRDTFRKIANGHDNDFAKWANVIDKYLTATPNYELRGALIAMIEGATEGHFHSGGAPDDHPLIKRARAALNEHITGE